VPDEKQHPDMENFKKKCAQCGAQMRLFGIEGDSSGSNIYSFECPKCGHVDAESVPTR